MKKEKIVENNSTCETTTETKKLSIKQMIALRGGRGRPGRWS